MRALACLPDRLGTVLLHAALDPPDRALAAWHQARPQLDLDPDSPPREVNRLLPLVHRNLGDRIDDPDRSQLQARYDKTKAANEDRIALAARWLALLELGGVSASVLKGIPLVRRDYGDLGVRPMADIDLIVPAGEASRALDLLEGAGWHDAGDCSRAVLKRLYHGSGMLHPDGGSLDVHWQLAGFLTGAFEPRLEPIDVGGRRTTTLDRTDTLLHVCLHGAWNGSAATTRWVVDAVTVLRAAQTAGDTIDADRLLEVARTHQVGAILGAALDHVATEHGAPVPDGLPAALLAQPVGWRVRRRQRVVTMPVDTREAVRGLRHLRAYWAYTRWSWSDGQALRTFPAFLVELWGLESPWSLPAAVVTRPLRRLAGRRSG